VICGDPKAWARQASRVLAYPDLLMLLKSFHGEVVPYWQQVEVEAATAPWRRDRSINNGDGRLFKPGQVCDVEITTRW